MTKIKNYRIKREVLNGKTKYYIQRRVLWLFWWDMFHDPHYGTTLSFQSYEKAKEKLLETLGKPLVEYLPIK